MKDTITPSPESATPKPEHFLSPIIGEKIRILHRKGEFVVQLDKMTVSPQPGLSLHLALFGTLVDASKQDVDDPTYADSSNEEQEELMPGAFPFPAPIGRIGKVVRHDGFVFGSLMDDGIMKSEYDWVSPDQISHALNEGLARLRRNDPPTAADARLKKRADRKDAKRFDSRPIPPTDTIGTELDDEYDFSPEVDDRSKAQFHAAMKRIEKYADAYEEIIRLRNAPPPPRPPRTLKAVKIPLAARTGIVVALASMAAIVALSIYVLAI